MTYAYDDYIQMPTKDLYDTAVMKMAIEAAKDMYEKGEGQLKEFYKTYGDFMSPLAKDMETYGNMIAGVRDVIDSAYANGIDLLRTPQGRSMIAQAINKINPADINKLRQSAQNANLFLKAKAELQSKGLYNKLLSKYDEPDLSTYDTLQQGVWDKMSPTPYQNMATFGNPYFEGMKPNIKQESKNGIVYRVESITMDDLKNIADSHFNELVNTPQGNLMYQYYRDLVGGDNNPNADLEAREMFNNAVADGQKRRIYQSDNYEDNWLKKQELNLKQKQLELTAQRNSILQEANQLKYNGGGSGSRSRSNSGSGGSSNSKTPVSYYEPMYQNLITNTINNDPYRTSTFGNKEFNMDFGSSLYQSQQNIAENYFGDGTTKSIYGGNTSVNRTSFGFDPKIKWENGNAVLDMNPTTGSSRNVQININKTIRPDLQKSDVFIRRFKDKYNDYLDRLSLDYESGIFADTWNHGKSRVSEVTQDGKTIERLRGKNYVYMAPEDIDKVYSGKELAARAAGVTGAALEAAIAETKRIRTRLKASNNNVMRGSGKMLGVGLHDTGQYGAYAKIHVAQYNGSNDLNNEEDAYIMTPYQSTPNPNFSKDGRFNLEFDQTLDLSRKNIDNAAIRGLGVSSNTGTIDNTLSDPTPWYTMEGLNQFGWLNDDIEE